MLPRPLVRRAAVALTVPLLAGAVAAAPALGAVTPSWRVTHVDKLPSSLNVVAATGPRDAWAAGFQCDSPSDCTPTPLLVAHWDGTAWRTMAAPGGLGGLAPGQFAAAVAASSPANAWVFADAARGPVDYTVAQHWTGKGWAKPVAFQARAAIRTAVTSGPRDAWAFGQLLAAQPQPYVVHYTGAKWARIPFPLDAQAASALSAGDIWVVGSWVGKAGKGSSPFGVEHWTRGGWHKVAVPPLSLPKGAAVQASNVVADGPGDVWAAGFLGAGMGVAPGIVLLHWNGKAFTRIPVPYPVTSPFALTGDGAGGFWLSATQFAKASFTNYLYHYSGGHWTRIPVPNEPENLTQVSAMAAIPGTRSVWATGAQTRTSGGTGQPQGIILKGE